MPIRLHIQQKQLPGGHFVLWHSKKCTYCTFKTFLVFWIEVLASDDQSEALLKLKKQNKENKA